ncbi:hypothetical protein HMI55_004534 [Coelomomyces lativittatus]|nr:hypothetical protein HMI55_004534 [Coelomomyces lativittatus]
MLHQYWPVSSIPPHVCQLIQRCWPGPLTLLVPLCKNVPMHYCTSSPSPLSTLVTCGLPSVAFRFPRHPLARALIDLTQVPLAAPSANRSGRPSPTCVSHVVHDYQEGPYPLTVLEGGPCEEGLESSIVWVVDEPPLLVRPGPWTFASLRKIPGWHHLQLHPSMRTTMMNVSEEEKEKEEEAQVHDASSSSTQETHFNLIQHKESPSTTLSTPFRSSSPTLLSSSSSSSSSPIAPGMKYKHYSPEVPVHVVTDPDFLPSYLTHLLHGSSPSKRHPKKIGVLLLTSIPSSTMTWLRTPSSMFEVVDHHQTPSQTFFDGLRTLDQPRTLSTLVVVPPPSHHPQAMALWNRLKKAASVWIDRPDTVDLKEEGLRSKDNGWNGSHSK